MPAPIAEKAAQQRLARAARYFMHSPVPIPETTLMALRNAGVDPRVARINLESVKAILRIEKRWSKARTVQAELEYKRMLTLLLWNPGLPHPIVPTRLVDEIWHRHILDTRAYHQDMQELFGEYLHHFPYLGFQNEESLRLKNEAFELSCQLYERTFGEPFSASTVKRLAVQSAKRSRT